MLFANVFHMENLHICYQVFNMENSQITTTEYHYAFYTEDLSMAIWNIL